MSDALIAVLLIGVIPIGSALVVGALYEYLDERRHRRDRDA